MIELSSTSSEALPTVRLTDGRTIEVDNVGLRLGSRAVYRPASDFEIELCLRWFQGVKLSKRTWERA